MLDPPGRNTAHPSAAPAKRLHSPYHNEIQRQLRDVFSLTDFRENQLEAITATMDGKDVFVLMPTGGGKSLCYQLPAVCTTGRTHGLTIVVSPLTALMEDQVSALTAKGIDAFFWSAETSQLEVNARLWNGDKKPSLLYITPEKLRASPSCRNLLEKLYHQKQLARFAIDEAHCISTWGQDFRNAYQGLGQLRGDYPDVPIIALTATANQRTRDDIINQLQLRNPAKFIQSFNRPNLKYVIKRKKNVLADIVDFINTEHQDHSGIIYCLSRKSCEQVSGQLKERGVAAEFFHAGLSKEEKNRLLEDWKGDKFRIIVATIAFGMGIDKADVRFVIHYDLPKCLSGYYQETGRAGRDGKPADCVLYYAFKDFKTICWMIEHSNDREEPLMPEAVQRQKDAAREVVKYCANISECRRVQVLRHFGQDFDERDCRRGCDNCLDDRQAVVEDVTVVATSIIDVMQAISNMKGKITLPQLTGVLRGSNAADIRNRGWAGIAGFGTCKSLSKELVELALDRLLDLKILLLTTQRQHNDFHHEYVEVWTPLVT
ncbi:ATP-dependent DNA helicase [Macrolepiota fuliginosa MF-IS2]|uniref:ATP-dependent DNA helicase n=1 Tax=Macrolepiota fuliginosa MF-IS2 TaxID=1400762 RepID=A0A9P6C8D0_9AGAR|nr:ATP-dependent DNA helicase [Macrolepiota fuliginosa MF-IS2]